MNEDLTGKRVKALEDNIHQDLKLLKDYEDKERYETDPRHKGKYDREIERQRESLTQSQKEYDKLRRQMTPEELQSVTDLLQRKGAKLDKIQNLLLPPIWNVPHHRNPNFTGREGILSDLSLALTSGEPTAWKQVLTGKGGVGKTQLAVEYIYRHKADYRVIWWVQSEELVTMAADYASLAVDLNLPEKDSTDQTKIVKAVKRWLEHNPGWLLIFDNAQDLREVRDYIPQGGAGHVIITSRNSDWGSVARLLSVQVFDRAESIEFLGKRTGQEDEKAADTLADELGDLPSALEQAGAYIKTTGRSLSDYPKLFRESDTVPTHLDYPAKVDQLGRKAFAEKLAKLIRRIRYENKKSDNGKNPFLLHIHGPWGSGKTTMLYFMSNFLKKELEKDSDPQYETSKWVVVHFNAWQHQRLGPPWWSLMDAVFHDAFQQLGDRWHAIFKLWIPEWRWRLCTGRLHYYLAFALFFWILASIVWGIFPNSNNSPTSLQTLASFAKSLSTIVALIVTVLGLVLGISHSLLPGSARAARTFMESTHDPLQYLEDHFEKLVDWIQKPVVIFIDDLDRCEVRYTVELLEGLQTLFRKAGITYVIAADRRWLYTSYEKYYDDFTNTVTEPGRPLGHLFLEKTFQLSVSLPRLSPELQKQYWQYLIGSDKSKIPEEEDKARNTAQLRLQQLSTPEEILTEISIITDDPIYDQVFREEAIVRLADPEVEAYTENALKHFAPLLEPNPRAMKRLVNAYGIQRDLNILRGDKREMDPKKLALWTIIILRWPLLAEYLADHPEMINGIDKEKLTIDETLQKLFQDPSVRDVINGEGVDTSLDERAIRDFAGLRTSDNSIVAVA
jgi:Cdc6-like AAA superfamily ATPase